MCIRDRVHAASIAHLRELLAADHRYVFTLIQKFQPSKAAGCLLYTSDAADERSSVDLGGRRIIKKKRSTLTERTDLQQQADEAG